MIQDTDGLSEDIFRSKEDRRNELAKLPYEKKVQIVVAMQEMQAPILRARGREVKVWKLDTSDRP